MRSIRWLAAVTGILALGTACGGDNGGGGVEPNEPPVANFTAPSCTANVACAFTDASTDDNDDITGWAWDFNDPTSGTNNTSDQQNPAHTFATAGTYNVSLTVTDGGGEESTPKIVAVTVTVGTPVNQAPTASFSLPSCGLGVDCAFHSGSTDPDGPTDIVSTQWNFGDASSPNNTAEGVDVSHRYAVAGSYSVTLTVTDIAGATGTTTQTVTVLPAPAVNCTTNGTVALCTLDITARSTVKLTLTSHDCELSGNRLSVVEPFRQNAFENICNRTVPIEYTVVAGGGAAAVFEAATQVHVQFNRGNADPEDPVPGPPAARVEGTYPNWTLTVDDGGNPTGQNEPDFNDVLVSIQATAAP